MQNSTKRYWTVGIQGLLSGLPFAAITNALQARFIDAGASLILVGSLSLLGQIYLYKFLLAPLSDSIKPPLLETNSSQNQGWIKFNQFALIITLTLMALLSAKQTPLILLAVAFLTALFSAFQDVNIDSYRIKLLKPEEMSQGSAYYLLGFRIGMLFAGGVSIVLGGYVGWRFSYVLLALIMLIGMLLSSSKQPIRQIPHKKQAFYQIFLQACIDLKKRPHILTLFAFIVSYGLGDAFTIAVNNTFLMRVVHFSLAEIAFYANTLNLGMLLISTIVARFCFKYINLTACLIWFSIAQIITLLLYAFVAATGPNKTIMVTAILMEGLSGGLIATAIVLVISNITREPFTTTQYAILSAVAAFKNVLLGPVAALVVKYFNWTDLYALGALLSLPGTYLAWKLSHYLNRIDLTSEDEKSSPTPINTVKLIG